MSPTLRSRSTVVLVLLELLLPLDLVIILLIPRFLRWRRDPFFNRLERRLPLACERTRVVVRMLPNGTNVNAHATPQQKRQDRPPVDSDFFLGKRESCMSHLFSKRSPMTSAMTTSSPSTSEPAPIFQQPLGPTRSYSAGSLPYNQQGHPHLRESKEPKFEEWREQTGSPSTRLGARELRTLWKLSHSFMSPTV